MVWVTSLMSPAAASERIWAPNSFSSWPQMGHWKSS